MTTPKTQKQAQALGLNRYWPGTECPSGHIAPHSVHNRVCIECLRETGRRLRAEGPKRRVVVRVYECLKPGLLKYNQLVHLGMPARLTPLSPKGPPGRKVKYELRCLPEHIETLKQAAERGNLEVENAND